jgi:hypothetical protein
MSRRYRDRDVEAFRAVGTPFRAVLRFTPLTRFALRQAAMARHHLYVDALYGGTPQEREARERHRQYVKAFYGY